MSFMDMNCGSEDMIANCAEFKVRDLRAMANQCGVKSTGNKADLCRQIAHMVPKSKRRGNVDALRAYHALSKAEKAARKRSYECSVDAFGGKGCVGRGSKKNPKLGVREVRGIARACGIKNVTSKPKDMLCREIASVTGGTAQLLKTTGRRGALLKSIGHRAGVARKPKANSWQAFVAANYDSVRHLPNKQRFKALSAMYNQ